MASNSAGASITETTGIRQTAWRSIRPRQSVLDLIKNRPEMLICLPMESRCVRMAPVPWA